MSGDARQEVEDLEALHHDNPDADSESHELSIVPTGSYTGSDEELDCEEILEETGELREPREPRRWLTESAFNYYIQEDAYRRRRPSDVSIFSVPNFLKDTQLEAYVPRRVSLGPYHHGRAELTSMDHDKGRALRRMMKRFTANMNLPFDPNNWDFVNRAVVEILKLEDQIRDIYEENISCRGETLARVLCLDGCFLLEVLRTLSGNTLFIAEEEAECYDPIFGETKLHSAAKDVLHDILILENQIPFIVLRTLLQLELNSVVVNVEEKLLDVLAHGILPFFFPFHNKNLAIQHRSCHHRHLLECLHTAIASPTFDARERVGIPIELQGKNIACNSTERIPHAVKLRNAGIKFSALQGGIRQIKFDGGSATISLPPISIDDRTERVFRNLIAYEVCKPSEINCVICYVRLMNDLIDTEQDVALMRRMGVLENLLGRDKEVADLFNGLCKEVTLYEPHVFDDLREKVNAHYNNKMMVKIGKLVQDNFSSPWKDLGLTGAIFMLLLTMLQTIFTIISTYQK